jgi:hypothetical protein
MIKLIVKLAIAALVANLCWRVGSAYLSFYRFKDSVKETALYSKGKSDGELRQKVLDLASTYDVLLDDAALSIRREENHTYVAGSYKQPVDLFPGYQYEWPFTFDIDAYTITPVTLDLKPPQ